MIKGTPVITVILLMILFLSQTATASQKNDDKNIVILATLEALAKDLEVYKTNNTIITFIVPGNVDPHHYSLTPSDYEKIREASMIVSTLHIPFEFQIEKIVSSEKKPVKLMELPFIPGLNIIKNPLTGQPVLHMPTYNLDNYILFMYWVKKELQQLNPNYSEFYNERFQETLEQALKIKSELGSLPEKTIIATSDSLLYALSNIKTKKIILFTPEPDLAITSQDIHRIENALRNEKNIMIAINGIPTKNGFRPVSQKDQYLYKIAKENDIPILYIIPPPYPLSTLEKTRSLLVQLDILQKIPETRDLNVKSSEETIKYESFSLALMFSATIYTLFILYRINEGLE